MQPQLRGKLPKWGRWVANQNPFYVISVAMVLYGVHVSFSGGAELESAWMMTKILGGYTLLLAAVGVLVVRVARVWEDARTILLLNVLLLVAMSVSFDRVCLDNSHVGLVYLTSGLFFAISLTEAVLRCLQVRLAWAYRLPFYILSRQMGSTIDASFQ